MHITQVPDRALIRRHMVDGTNALGWCVKLANNICFLTTDACFTYDASHNCLVMTAPSAPSIRIPSDGWECATV